MTSPLVRSGVLAAAVTLARLASAASPLQAQVVVSSSPVMSAESVTAQPAPRGVRSRPNLGPIISGAVLLGVGWVTNLVAGLPAGDDPFERGSDARWDTFRLVSLVPVAGPWVMLSLKPTAFSEDYWGPWLVVNGLLQTGGLVLLIVGIATPSEEVVEGPYVRVTPVVGPEPSGLAFSGAF